MDSDAADNKTATPHWEAWTLDVGALLASSASAGGGKHAGKRGGKGGGRGERERGVEVEWQRVDLPVWEAGVAGVPQPRLSFAMVPLRCSDGQLLVFGGVCDEMEEDVVHSTFLNDAWVLRIPLQASPEDDAAGGSDAGWVRE